MKTAIIIGATSGIGREVAARLIEDGWKVGITGRRTEALEAFRSQFGADRVFIAIRPGFVAKDILNPDKH